MHGCMCVCMCPVFLFARITTVLRVKNINLFMFALNFVCMYEFEYIYVLCSFHYKASKKKVYSL